MVDRFKLIARLEARGRRKLEKIRAKREAREERARKSASVENAAAMAKRDAMFVELDALNARRAARAGRRGAKEAKQVARQRAIAMKGPPTDAEIAAKEARRLKREDREAHRAALALERSATLPVIPLDKRADAVHAKVRGAAERAAAVLKRNAMRLPPLPYVQFHNEATVTFADDGSEPFRSKAPPLPY